jgi:hypothetical protein
MKIIDKNTFFDITQTFNYVPFTQSEGWWKMNSIKEENRFLFFIDSQEKPTLACMAFTMKRFGLKLLVIDGECFADEKSIDSKKIRDFYKKITQAGFDMIEINSSLPYSALYEIGIRQAGFLKPVGLFSTPLSILIDLQKPIEYDKNWQKNLRQTEKHHLLFIPVINPTNKDVEDYILIHNEMKNKKGFYDRLSHKGLETLLQDNNFKLFFVKNELQKLIAGIIVFLRRDMAISIFSTTSEEGRQKSAAYFRDNEMYHFLQTKSFLHFDRGRISPAAHKKNNLFLFKNGVKGDYLLYCGEWSWYKKQIYRPLMYFVKKYLFKRVDV